MSGKIDGDETLWTPMDFTEHCFFEAFEKLGCKTSSFNIFKLHVSDRNIPDALEIKKKIEKDFWNMSIGLFPDMTDDEWRLIDMNTNKAVYSPGA